MIYTYSQKNRLDEPHAYMYTQFQGEPLLEAYLSSRLDAINCHAVGDSYDDSESDYCFVAQSLVLSEKLYKAESIEMGEKFDFFLPSKKIVVVFNKANHKKIIQNSAKLIVPMTTDNYVPTMGLLRALTSTLLLGI